MYIIEDLNFNDIQERSLADNLTDELTATVIAKLIHKEINKIDVGVFHLAIGPTEEVIRFDKNKHMLVIAGDFSIHSRSVKKLPEWCQYVYFEQITLSNIDSITDIENFPQHCKLLRIESCPIHTLDGLPEDLSELCIVNCNRLQDIVGIPSTVISLAIHNSSDFKSLQGGENLELYSLNLQNLPNLHSLYGINHHVVELMLKNIDLFVKTHFECVRVQLWYYNEIEQHLLLVLPLCRKLSLIKSNISSLKGINDDIKELYIENNTDREEFILEEHLPWNLEILGINKYDMNKNHFNRMNNGFMFPETLKEVHISTYCQNPEMLKDHILSKINVKFDVLITYVR